MDRFEILVGVKGGGSISGESGQIIKSELASIINQINSSNDLKLKLKVNPASLRQMRSVVRNSFKAPIPVRLTLDKGSLNAIKSQLRNIVSQGVVKNQGIVKTKNIKTDNINNSTLPAVIRSNNTRNNNRYNNNRYDNRYNNNSKLDNYEKKALQAYKDRNKSVVAYSKAYYNPNAVGQTGFWENESKVANAEYKQAEKYLQQSEAYKEKIAQEQKKTRQKVGANFYKSQDSFFGNMNKLYNTRDSLLYRNLHLRNNNGSSIDLFNNIEKINKVNHQINSLKKKYAEVYEDTSRLDDFTNKRNDNLRKSFNKRQQIYSDANKQSEFEKKSLQAQKDYNKALAELEKVKNKPNSKAQTDYWSNEAKNAQKAKEEADKNLKAFKQSDDYKTKSNQEQIKQQKQLGVVRAKNQDTNETKMNSLLEKRNKLLYKNFNLQRSGASDITLRNNAQEIAKTSRQINGMVKNDKSLIDTVKNSNKTLKQEMGKRQKIYEADKYSRYDKSIKEINSLYDNNKKVRKYGSEDIKKLREEARRLATSGKTSTKEWDEFNKKIKETKKNFKDSGLMSKSLGATLKENAAKFTRWFGISQGIMTLTRGVGMMWENVRNVDAAMTELKKVTDETNKTYDSFYENATSRARDLGASVSDTVNATADFARLGYNLKEAETTANAAIVYKNVGDGIEDIGTASDSIISTMKAFNIEATDAMSIVDKFNEVGKNIAQLYSNIQYS